MCVLLLVEHITECISTLLFFGRGYFVCLRLNYLVLVLIFLLQKERLDNQIGYFHQMWCCCCLNERGTWDNITDSKLRLKTVSYGVG